MGRGRGKGKKPSAVSIRDNNVSVEDEKIPLRRRGPQKPMKDEMLDKDIDKIEDEDDEVGDDSNKLIKTGAATENGRKRKRAIVDPAMEENLMGNKTTTSSILIKNVGYRQNGSRRKNKPRRAAEVGVRIQINHALNVQMLP